MVYGARRKLYDAKELASNISRTFKDRSVEYERAYGFSWPARFKNIGESLAVCYESDKWKPKGAGGRRPTEVYKHIAESRNWVYAVPGVIYDYRNKDRRWPVVGPMVVFDDATMPEHIAVLGKCECVQLKTYAGTDDEPTLGEGDEGVVEVLVPGAILGASEMIRNGNPRPFLVVYHPTGGVVMLILGERLGIGTDGIFG
jgi:hypothetical protein